MCRGSSLYLGRFLLAVVAVFQLGLFDEAAVDVDKLVAVVLVLLFLIVLVEEAGEALGLLGLPGLLSATPFFSRSRRSW